jgi:ribosomal protein S3AE
MNQPNSWYKVKAVDFDNAEIGNVYGNETNMPNRLLFINANNLPEIKTKPGFKLGFRLMSSTENTANAQLESLVLSREQVGRMVRHNSSKLDVVRKVKINGKEYAIKTIIIISKAENKYRKFVRAEANEFIDSIADKKDLKELVLEVLAGKVQNQLHKKLSKIYPTRATEVRMIEKLSN